MYSNRKNREVYDWYVNDDTGTFGWRYFGNFVDFISIS